MRILLSFENIPESVDFYSFFVSTDGEEAKDSDNVISEKDSKVVLAAHNSYVNVGDDDPACDLNFLMEDLELVQLPADTPIDLKDFDVLVVSGFAM